MISHAIRLQLVRIDDDPRTDLGDAIVEGYTMSCNPALTLDWVAVLGTMQARGDILDHHAPFPAHT